MLRLALALCVLAVASPAHATPPPLRVGVIGAFTGGSAPMGLAMRAGVRLAAEQVNRTGGVLGRRVELVERDDGGVPAIGASHARALSAPPAVDAVIGFVNTPVALPALDQLQARKIPTLIAVATASELTRRHAGEATHYIFRVATPDTLQAELIVREAISERGLRRVAILADNSAYGAGGERELTHALARRGLTPVLVQRFGAHERDLGGAVRAAREAGAELVFAYALGPQLAAIADAMAQQGWRVPLMGSWTLALPNFIDHAGPAAEGARMVQTLIEDGSDPAQQAFVATLRTRQHTRRLSSPVAAAQGHDALLLWAAALRQAGSSQPDTVVTALEQLREPVDGVLARYYRPFSRHDHEAVDARIPLIGVVRGGRVGFAHPQDKARLRPDLTRTP